MAAMALRDNYVAAMLLGTGKDDDHLLAMVETMEMLVAERRRLHDMLVRYERGELRA